MKYVLIFLLFATSLVSKANPDDTLSYNSYKDRVVLYSDLGFNSAPFSIKNDFIGGYDKIYFKHNQKVGMGLGIAYKWFALRIGFTLPGTLRSEDKYGPASYQDFGLKFNIKKTFWDLDIRYYTGYSIHDAYQWNDTLDASTPNSLVPGVGSANASINCWYFRSDEFNMNSFFGIKGDFKQSQGTWYFKNTFNFFGVGSDHGPLVPEALIDTTKTIASASGASALDLGVVPGYAYVHRINNWQFAAFGGLGGVVQAKFYNANGITRGFLGLAPRIDMRFIAGYSKPKYFIWITSNFDIKSIAFNEVKYRQVYHSVKLVGGFRLKKREKKKSKS